MDRPIEPENVKTDLYVGQFDWAEVPPQAAVLEAIETVSEMDHDKFEVLYEYIDPDALESLFADATESQAIELMFRFDPFRVSIRSDGYVFVEPTNQEYTRELY
jgi:hypothetical protein